MNNNVVQLINNEDAILDQALHWLTELERGLSPEREVLLREWLARSPAHKEVFLEVTALWDDLDVLSNLSDVFPYKTTNRPWYKTTGLYPIAATILVCLLLSFYYAGTKDPQLVETNNVKDDRQLVATYRTKVGEHSTFKLPDNSLLTLNTNSEVNVEYSNTQRNIHLLHGEVHVEVAHDNNRKFYVQAGGKVIEAVGTAFNVLHHNALDIELIVTEGTVLVSEAIKEVTTNPILNSVSQFIGQSSANEKISVTAGEQIHLNVRQKVKQSEITIEKATHVMESKLSWMKGKVIFNGEPLEQAIKEISRYSNWTLELKGEQLKKRKIVGRFQTGNIELLVEILKKNFNIDAEYTDTQKIILTAAH
ncbi:FecR domain-containing protein [Paraglaciecola sp. L3A3]|uniref:FecR family protein n=1 Tax=Paraglaciecola sp. L3A3 TaxID=2686358 RepID=UPI00131C697B|nr:FecR domain-containing protein [Paraglaciecola sp. L3A3]